VRRLETCAAARKRRHRLDVRVVWQPHKCRGSGARPTGNCPTEALLLAGDARTHVLRAASQRSRQRTCRQTGT